MFGSMNSERTIKAFVERKIEWVNEWEHVRNIGWVNMTISQTGLDKQSKALSFWLVISEGS